MAAREVGRAILEAASRLDQNPRRGRIVPELWEHGICEYREIIVSPYRIIYRIQDEEVRIMAVLDARRNLADILLQRLLR